MNSKVAKTTQALAPKYLWWLYYRNNGNVVGVAIIEAPTLYHARMKAAVYGIGKAVDYSEGKEVEEGHQALVPRNCIGRLLSANEAKQLFDRMCEARADGATTLEPVEREDMHPVWWISFLDGGVVIMEASSLLHARTLAAASGLGRVTQFAEGHFIGPKRAKLIPNGSIGRILSSIEAGKLRDLIEYDGGGADHSHVPQQFVAKGAA
jgi:hypothetical protein